MAIYDKYENIAQSVGTVGMASAANQIRKPSELETIAQRIADITGCAHSIAGQLQIHGDAVFGSYPEGGAQGQERDTRSGQIGAITDALDRLDEAMTRLQSEASRNCCLA